MTSASIPIEGRPVEGRPVEGRPVEGRRERKKRETRARILVVARTQFSRLGYDNATVEGIAEAADISKPTLFNYFPSKLAILQALVPEIDRRFAETANRIHSEEHNLGARLNSFFAYLARTTQQAPQLTQALLVQALRAYEDPTGRLGRHRFPLLEASFSRIIEEGIASGEVRQDISVARLVQYTTAVYVYGLLNWLADASFSVEEELKVASQFLASALAVTPPSPRPSKLAATSAKKHSSGKRGSKPA